MSNPAYQPSPIFVQTYELLRWLIPSTLNFPKSQRGGLGRQIQTQAFALYESLVDAVKSGPKRATLQRADGHLAKLRAYLRLARDLNLITPGQYAHVSQMHVEIGNLLGGWLHKTGVSDEPISE